MGIVNRKKIEQEAWEDNEPVPNETAFSTAEKIAEKIPSGKYFIDAYSDQDGCVAIDLWNNPSQGTVLIICEQEGDFVVFSGTGETSDYKRYTQEQLEEFPSEFVKKSLKELEAQHAKQK